MLSVETLISAARLSSAEPSGSISAKKLRRRPALPRLTTRSKGTDSERIVLPSPNVSMAFAWVTKSNVRRLTPTKWPTISP